MNLTVEGKIYINGTLEECCIGIEHGKITAVKKILRGDEHHSFNHQVILPAGIDIHVHFRDPGFTYKEDFYTGSQAAAFGGISCVFDMPNTQPQTININALKEKIRLAGKKSVVDFGLYASINDTNIEKISELTKYCNGFKIYLGSTTNSLLLSEHNLKKALIATVPSKKPVLIHAENNHCLEQSKMIENNLIDHLNSHPATCEEASIKTIVHLAKTIPSKIHICHLSSCEGFEILKTRPNYVSVGVTPNHLFFNSDMMRSYQTLYKVNPPIRTHFDTETLWQGMSTGMIDLIESDHAPHTKKEKNTAFNNAPSGMPGVETMLPLLLAEVKRNNLRLDRVMSLLCEKPARLLNIPKGSIEVGRDADFIVVDFKKQHTIKGENLHSKCGWTPFEDWSAIFPTHVFIRGEKLIADYEMQGKQGFGKFVGA